jgi:hypothetical protein
MRERPRLRGGHRRRRMLTGLAGCMAIAAMGAAQAGAASPPTTGCVGTPPPTQYPDCTYPQPHSMGMFDRMASGSFKFAPADQDINKTYFGLPFQHQIWDFFLRNDAGKYYQVSPAVLRQPTGALTPITWTGGGFQESPSGGLVPDPRHALWSGGSGTTFSLAGGDITYKTTSVGPNGGPETITYDEDSFEYTAPNSNIHIEGKLSGNGNSWDLPWREPDGKTNEFFYNMHGYAVEGTYHGEHVKGHVALEEMWASVPYFTSWWVRNRVGHWSFFNIEYKDGSSESGQFLCGEYGFRAAIVTDRSGKSTVNTDNINTYVKPYGWLYELGTGEQWKFIADQDLDGLFTLRFGAVQRAHEKRKITGADSVGFDFGRPCTPEPLNAAIKSPGGGNGHHHKWSNKRH